MVSLNGPSGQDFELFAKMNDTPNWMDYNWSSRSGDSHEGFTILFPGNGTLYIMVYSQWGSGYHNLVATIFGPETSLEVNVTTLAVDAVHTGKMGSECHMLFYNVSVAAGTERSG